MRLIATHPHTRKGGHGGQVTQLAEDHPIPRVGESIFIYGASDRYAVASIEYWSEPMWGTADYLVGTGMTVVLRLEER